MMALTDKLDFNHISLSADEARAMLGRGWKLILRRRCGKKPAAQRFVHPFYVYVGTMT